MILSLMKKNSFDGNGLQLDVKIWFGHVSGQFSGIKRKQDLRVSDSGNLFNDCKRLVALMKQLWDVVPDIFVFHQLITSYDIIGDKYGKNNVITLKKIHFETNVNDSAFYIFKSVQNLAKLFKYSRRDFAADHVDDFLRHRRSTDAINK